MKKIFIGLALSVLTVGFIANQPPRLAQHTVVSSVSFEYTLDELTKSAQAIAVVRATGSDRVHWNNADNVKWVSSSAGGAMIYNDQEVVVVELLRGDLDRNTTIRNLGGTVGDTRYELEGLKPLIKGIDYLVFLTEFDTPTQEGTEKALSFVGQEQGVFVASGASFISSHGLSVTSDQLRP